MQEDNVEVILNNAVIGNVNERIASGEVSPQRDSILQAVIENANKLVEHGYAQLVDDFSFEANRDSLLEYSECLRSADNLYVGKLNSLWRKAFAASDTFYLLIMDTAEDYRRYVVRNYKDDVPYMFKAQILIHKRAIQMYQEIMCLVKNGYPDGAFARWRSLYELSAVSRFIQRYGEEVAEAFYTTRDFSDYRGWARYAACFSEWNKDKHIKIKDIIDNSGLNHEEWKTEYEEASKIVHATPIATFTRIGVSKEFPGIVPTDRTHAGIAKAARNAAVALAVISECFFIMDAIPYVNAYLVGLSLNKWVEGIYELYGEVNEDDFLRCFTDEDISRLTLPDFFSADS